MSKLKVKRCNTVSICTNLYRRVGGGVILTRILQNIQEGLSVTFSIQLHCPVLWLECSVPFSSGQLIPSTGSSCDESLFKWKKQKEKPKSLSWETVALCTAACVDVCVLLGALGLSWAWEDIHLIRWSLFKVGVVRKGIDILLDHFVAELVLLLRRRRKEHGNACYLKIHLGRGWQMLMLMLQLTVVSWIHVSQTMKYGGWVWWVTREPCYCLGRWKQHHRKPHQCLHHVGPLQPETLDCLEYIEDALRLHPLQDRTQRTEGPCSTSTSTVWNKRRGREGSESKSKQYMKMTIITRLHCFASREEAARWGDLTCSAPWWGGFLTAAAVSAPLRLNWSCLCRRWGCPPLASRGNGTGALLGPCSPGNVGKGIKTDERVMRRIDFCASSLLTLLLVTRRSRTV